jgi:hypothetical protein
MRVARVSVIGFATDRYGPRGVPVLTVMYRVRPGAGRLRPGDDVSELQWFDPREVPWRSVAFPGMRGLLRRYLASRRGSIKGM